MPGTGIPAPQHGKANGSSGDIDTGSRNANVAGNTRRFRRSARPDGRPVRLVATVHKERSVSRAARATAAAGSCPESHRVRFRDVTRRARQVLRYRGCCPARTSLRGAWLARGRGCGAEHGDCSGGGRHPAELAAPANSSIVSALPHPTRSAIGVGLARQTALARADAWDAFGGRPFGRRVPGGSAAPIPVAAMSGAGRRRCPGQRAGAPPGGPVKGLPGRAAWPGF